MYIRKTKNVINVILMIICIFITINTTGSTKMMKSSKFLVYVLFLFSTLFAQAQFSIERRAERSISDQEIKSTVLTALKIKESSDLFESIVITVYEDHYVASLFSATSYESFCYRIHKNRSGEVTVIGNYIDELEALRNEPCGTCPDETIEIVVSGSFSDPNHISRQKVREAYTELINMGFKVKELGGAEENPTSIRNWLSCKNVKVWGRIGHGTQTTISFAGRSGVLTANDFASMELQGKSLIINSCYVHNPQFIPSMIDSAGADFFCGGNNVTLRMYESEFAWYNIMIKGIIDGRDFGELVTEENATTLSPGNRYGFTRQPDKIEVTSPNGGETYNLGASVTIEWSSIKTPTLANVAIDLYKANEKVATITSTTENDGLFEWAIDKAIEPGSDYTVKVYGTTGSVEDLSDNSFTLNGNPLITSSPLTVATEDIQWSYTVNAEDIYDNEISLTYKLNNAPTGMSIKSNVISWTPVEGQLTSDIVSLIVFDGAFSTEQKFSITVTAVNDAPTLTTATTQTVAEDTPITIDLTMTDASDVDNTLTDASILVGDGDNYTVSGQTITPTLDYVGDLTVPLTVTDGELNSETVNMTLTVTAVNDAPTLTTVTKQTVAEDTPITVALTMTDASDIDNTLTDASIFVGDGDNYTVSGQTITPTLDYVGDLTVPLTITDGELSSETVNMTVTLTPVNDAPTLTVVNAQTTSEETPLMVNLHMTNATDADNILTDANIILGQGDNYTASGQTITPNSNFVGTLTVPVSVTDGLLLSETVNMSVTVSGTNDAPILTETFAQTTTEDTPLEITLAMTDAVDPDGTIPTLVLNDGDNYVVEGTTITPTLNFNGELTVPVHVTDGALSSATVEMTITVTAVNDAPTLTVATDQITGVNTPITLSLAMTDGADVDSDLTDENLIIGFGENYIVDGLSITPNLEFVGPLTVPLTVNDGLLSSETVNMIITVSHVDAIIEVNDSIKSIGAFAVVPNIITSESEAHFIIGKKISGEGRIKILDYLGDIIDEQQFSVTNGGHFYWDLRNRGGATVSSGTYLVVLEMNGKVYTKKIAIKK